LSLSLLWPITRRRTDADCKQGSRLFQGRHDAERKTGIESAAATRAEDQPDSGPREQNRFVAEIDQCPQTGSIHLRAYILDQQFEYRIRGRWQLLESQELPHLLCEADEIAGA